MLDTEIPFQLMFQVVKEFIKRSVRRHQLLNCDSNYTNFSKKFFSQLRQSKTKMKQKCYCNRYSYFSKQHHSEKLKRNSNIISYYFHESIRTLAVKGSLEMSCIDTRTYLVPKGPSVLVVKGVNVTFWEL